MSTAGSPDPQTLHEGELDLLITDLVEAHFRPIAGDRHHWIGPVTGSLARLTDASEMRIEVRDGWPYRHPYVFVDGLVGRRHVGATGNTCLWFEDDDDYGDWLRLGTILTRVDSWVLDQEAGVSAPAADAHLYFDRGVGPLLTADIDRLIDLGQITRAPGESGALRARLIDDMFSVGDSGNIPVAWFWHAGFPAPPAQPSMIRDALTGSQQRDYDRIANGVSKGRCGVLLVLWDDMGMINALGIQVTHDGARRHRLRALEVARTDRSIMLLRSGPDAARMARQQVAVFGVGAIGSEVALLLARSGIPRLVLVDGEVLRPSNLSRHAASGDQAGKRKADAMASTIASALPHVDVRTVTAQMWAPTAVAAMMTGVALVVDATGSRAYTDMLSRITSEVEVPLVSAALYRGGRIGRVRVQWTGRNPLYGRSPSTGFPDIPADPGVAPEPRWETGCGAPVNNASPVSVAEVAAGTTRVIIDALTGRDQADRDLYSVYEAIEAPPFDATGTFVVEPLE